MAHILEYRRGTDRRRMPRGGRRTEDADGCAPLVLLVDGGDGAVSRSDAILAQLRFAVTTTGSVEEALRVAADLRPDVLVAGEADADRIRNEAPADVQVVVMYAALQANPELLVQEIRRTFRANQPL
jgi:hypothetical protein